MTAADFGEQTHEDGSLPASHDRGGDEPWQWELCSTVSAPHCRALQKYYRTAVERWGQRYSVDQQAGRNPDINFKCVF